ncbi:MAG: transcription termination factor Rho [Candidatus Eisenbacteria bacterium]|uniref:Transcription termination factor Rho n=1 Tax=Eiseniibacteriota bacterium TaxID=2212470 RepID=A0A849SIP2_UNCEI|nr:transcription termination factor Rho [Candidatus Eisenbacteria bacterium]
MGSAGPPMDASPDAGLTNGGVRPGPDGPRPAPEGPRQAPGPDGMRRMDGNGNNRRRRRRGRSARPVSNSAPGAYQGAPPNAPRQAPQPPQMSGGPRGRRRRTRPGAERRRGGLEVLREMQQAGVALDPTERLKLELPAGEGNPPYGDRATGRAIDLIAPIGRGQRCLIVAPPKTGKTRILQCIAASVAYNHPEVGIYALLVDERPEEVTDFKRNTPANVIAASSDMSIEDHIATAEYAMEVVAAQVIEGKDVVLLLDSITRLARAYNANTDGGGRTMSGGLDSNAMQAPRQIFGAARKIEDGGSLTIIGTALVDTGSRMDQIIFEEFKGTGNSEIFLSRELAERRIFPAIDIARSGTRKEEKLFPPDQLNLHQMLRRVLLQMPLQEAITKLADRLNKTKTNEEFFQLLRNNE